MTDFLTLAKPEDAESAFYRAFAQADLALMLRVWDDAPDICCIHPMGKALLGRAAVAAGWRDILSGDSGLRIVLEPLQMHAREGLAISLVHEHISVANETKPRPPILATNAYRRTPEGWRLILHHASPAVVSLDGGLDSPAIHLH
jgi:ketosteroid isomerase-like protein